jgi:hypothetical protein
MDDLLNILDKMHKMHIEQTVTKSCFSFDSDICVKDICRMKFNQATQNKSSFDSFVETCMKCFEENYPSEPFGYIHCDPHNWTNIALTTVHKFLQSMNPTQTIIFSNGCCALPDCPINRFYSIVLCQLTM